MAPFLIGELQLVFCIIFKFNFQMQVSVISFKQLLLLLGICSLFACKKIIQPPVSDVTPPFKNVYINGTVSLNIYDGNENTVTEAIGYSINPTIQDNALIITGWGNINLKIKQCDTIFINDNSIVNGVNSTKLRHVTFKISDVTSFTANSVSLTDSIDVIVGGSGTYTFSGTTNKLNVFINSSGVFSGSVKGSEMISKKCMTRINSTGDANVFVSDTLTGIINGDGNINYMGNPSTVIPILISGNGQLIKK